MAEGRQEGTSLEDFAGRRSGAGLSEESSDDEHQADVVCKTLVGEENADVASKILVRVESPDGGIEILVNPETSNAQDLQLQPRPIAAQGESDPQPPAEDLQPPAEDLQPPAEGFQRIWHWARKQLKKLWIKLILVLLSVASFVALYLYIRGHLSGHDHNQPQSTAANLDEDFTTMSMKVERKTKMSMKVKRN